MERHQPQNATRCIPTYSTNVSISHTRSTTLISTPSTFHLSKTQSLCLYGQVSILTGIKYVGKTPTTGNNIFYPTSSTNISRTYKGNKNIFQPPHDSHLFTILTSRTIPLYSTHLGNKTTLLSRYSFCPLFYPLSHE